MALQLMLGREQLRDFNQAQIIACLEYALDSLPVAELILSAAQEAFDVARQVVSCCARRGVSVVLWTMTCADRPVNLPRLQPALDFSGREWYGTMGVWGGIGKGDEKFSFSCPMAVCADKAGPDNAVKTAKELAATGLFLDRLRYPSPANGLEFIGSCSCPVCRDAYRQEYGTDWPDLCSLLMDTARDGRSGAEAFLRQAAPALEFRARRIARVAEAYADAAKAAGLRVGLDLLAPCLGILVGQDYSLLAHHADFIKPMLYCKATGPAGLPLEFGCFYKALTASGAGRQEALAYISTLSGLAQEYLEDGLSSSGFSPGLARLERGRAKLAMERSAGPEPALYAGIELVDHPAYATRINNQTRDEYITALGYHSLALCWNILYIPRVHIDALACCYEEL